MEYSKCINCQHCEAEYKHEDHGDQHWVKLRRLVASKVLPVC